MIQVCPKSRNSIAPVIIKHIKSFLLVTILIFGLTILGKNGAKEQEIIMVETLSTTNIVSPGDGVGGKKLPSTFPELAGLSGEDAKAKLRGEYPSKTLLSTIQVLPENSMVTMDYREDRVRIFVDENTGKVVKVPRIG